MTTKQRLKRALKENAKLKHVIFVLVQKSVGDLIKELEANRRAETKDEPKKEEPAKEEIKLRYVYNQDIIDNLVGKYVVLIGDVCKITQINRIKNQGQEIYFTAISPKNVVYDYIQLNLDYNIYFDADCKNIFFDGEKHILRKEEDNA